MITCMSRNQDGGQGRVTGQFCKRNRERKKMSSHGTSLTVQKVGDVAVIVVVPVCLKIELIARAKTNPNLEW